MTFEAKSESEKSCDVSEYPINMKSNVTANQTYIQSDKCIVNVIKDTSGQDFEIGDTRLSPVGEGVDSMGNSDAKDASAGAGSFNNILVDNDEADRNTPPHVLGQAENGKRSPENFTHDFNYFVATRPVQLEGKLRFINAFLLFS